MDNFDLRKYLAENKLIKEEEFKLYTTNVEYEHWRRWLYVPASRY